MFWAVQAQRRREPKENQQKAQTKKHFTSATRCSWTGCTEHTGCYLNRLARRQARSDRPKGCRLGFLRLPNSGLSLYRMGSSPKRTKRLVTCNCSLPVTFYLSPLGIQHNRRKSTPHNERLLYFLNGKTSRTIVSIHFTNDTKKKLKIDICIYLKSRMKGVSDKRNEWGNNKWNITYVILPIEI